MKKTAQVAMAIVSAFVVLLPQAAHADHARTVPVRYNTPAVGSTDLGGVCIGGQFNSCVEAEARAGETRVDIRIVDDSGLHVSGTVGQDVNGDGLLDWSESFCDATDHPGGLPIQNAILGQPAPVMVMPWLLPGVDQNTLDPCAGAATSGTVYFTFYAF